MKSGGGGGGRRESGRKCLCQTESEIVALVAVVIKRLFLQIIYTHTNSTVQCELLLMSPGRSSQGKNHEIDSVCCNDRGRESGGRERERERRYSGCLTHSFYPLTHSLIPDACFLLVSPGVNVRHERGRGGDGGKRGRKKEVKMKAE